METSWLEKRWARPLHLAFVFCLALGLLHAIKLYLRRQRLLRNLSSFPAPPTHWFHGHQKFLQEDKMEKLDEIVEKYPCAFPCWIGPFQAFFYIYDPDYAKTLLSRTDLKSQYLYKFMTPCLGKGLLNLDGPKWFQHRRLLTPGFHCDMLKTYVEAMAHSVNKMLDKWEKICSTQDTSIEVFEHISLMALDIIMKCAFGQETNCQINGTHDSYIKATLELGKIIFYRLYNFWHHHDIIFKFSPKGRCFQKLTKVLHQYTDGSSSQIKRCIALGEAVAKHLFKVLESKDVTLKMKACLIHTMIPEKIPLCKLSYMGASASGQLWELRENKEQTIQNRKKSREAGMKWDNTQKKYQDFLDIVLSAQAEDEDSFSDSDLRSEVNTFMLTGHDASAASLSWLLYCLALNPEHQDRCREEIKSILRDGSPITWDQLSEMSYTTMCIKETFRLIPPVPSISRELSKPLTFPDGRSLPAGMTVVLSIWGLHHNPAVWKSPKVFDPLRFTKENSDQRHPYSFLPFSAGPRNCLGDQFAMLELKVAIALILLHFKVTPDLTRPLAFSNHIILQPKHGIHLHLKKLPEC